AGQRLGQHLLGFGPPGSNTRPVPDHLHHDVADDEAGVADQPERLAQQRDAGRPRPLGPGGAEVRAEIAEPGRGQQRGADGVRRRHRCRTTSATLFTSPEASVSRLALYRLDQLVGCSVCGARSTSNTRASPSAPTTSRTPTSSALSAGTRTVRSPLSTLRTR